MLSDQHAPHVNAPHMTAPQQRLGLQSSPWLYLFTILEHLVLIADFFIVEFKILNQRTCVNRK